MHFKSLRKHSSLHQSFNPLIDPFEIMCDASDYAMGAVLGQTKDRKHHAIFYASKTLLGPQLNYETTENSFWLLFLLLISLDLS